MGKKEANVKKVMMQLLRSIVTVIVVGTMAVMIFSLRGELASARAELSKARSGAVTPQTVWVLCRFDLRPDADRATYVERTRSILETVRAEPGCLEYRLLGDAETDWEKPQRFGAQTLWMLEKWASVESLKAHLETPHMKAFGPTVRPLRAASTFHVLQDVCR